ncbi:DNA topoisomerase 3 [invertebrate metagenome]|uniref:DNA topoisomerase n=1 Tax=invertebrate metagenome TaxID=1711999 RepID=A0A2H9T758_9ZZZZ
MTNEDGMRLIIAEKPSLGRAIAEVLPKPHKKSEGYIETGGGNCVTWCIGHLLEQDEPSAYDPAYRQWKLEHLPIIPEQWLLKPKKETRKQLSVIKRLLKLSDNIVHAGDPDREGQLLVDEVLSYLNLSKNRRQKVMRLLINDMNPQAIKKALAGMRLNREFVPLSVSALARSRADWLYGINMTRACTVLGKREGYNGLLSVGRVQTPILGLVARRDQEIKQFEPKPFFDVYASLETDKKAHFRAKWQPSEACQPWMDEEGRVLDRRLAENVVRRITGKQGIVESAEDKKGKELPPLLYSLSALQIDAARRWNMTATQVLDCCQKLYEQKLLTYPRSDCRYLPEEHFSQAPDVLSVIRQNAPVLGKFVDGGSPSRKTRVWNDKKISAHHAIIPTARRASRLKLAEGEQRVYEMVARQYLAQFYPDHRFVRRKIAVRIEKGLFLATSRQTEQEGWKKLFPAQRKKHDTSPDSALSALPQPSLPLLKKGDALTCLEGFLQEKMTQAPLPFTDATLLSAMTGIARYVNSPSVRKILRETDGLGTEATRASIIELLFKRGFLYKEKQHIHATPSGSALVLALPDKISQPDMTAQWESQLNDMVGGRSSYDVFMASLSEEIHDLLVTTASDGLSQVRNLPPVAKPVYRKNRRAKNSKKIRSRA